MSDSGDNGPSFGGLPTPSSQNDSSPLTWGMISRGSYDERGGSKFKRVSRWVIGLVIAAIIITLIVDLVAGIGIFSS